MHWHILTERFMHLIPCLEQVCDIDYGVLQVVENGFNNHFKS